MKIAFVPIDNRPVCYTLPELTASINPELEFVMPKREWLGSLKKYASTDKIFDWLKSLEDIDALILPLDTVAYGGLISSRRCPETFEQIRARIEKLKGILEEKHCKIYAFSSIMRISNNNINEEEKPYWDKWGKKIFEYSFNYHKSWGIVENKEIPAEILQDYLDTRKRNFEINKIYLEWQKQGFFETLVFSKDDCAEFGLNVKEAKELEDLGAFVKTGADEIPLSLLSRALSDEFGGVKIAPIFLEPEFKHLISNYEDVSIEKSVKGQIELAGCEVSGEKDADILLYINNFKQNQGEIVMKTDTEPFKGEFSVHPKKQFMIADVRFANGSDNNFVEKIFSLGILSGVNFLGYSGWNTSANSLGSLICGALSRYYALRKGLNLVKSDMKFQQLTLTRFLDDWAYQANVRQTLSTHDRKNLSKKMKPYEEKIKKFVEIDKKVGYSFPWKRLFEVEIELS